MLLHQKVRFAIVNAVVPVCNGQCGTNSSSCGGLQDAYWKAVQIRQQFDSLYSKQEAILKNLLTKVKTDLRQTDSINSIISIKADFNRRFLFISHSFSGTIQVILLNWQIKI